jgi:hypothetical protein
VIVVPIFSEKNSSDTSKKKLTTANVKIDRDGIVKLNLDNEDTQKRVWEVIKAFESVIVEDDSKAKAE